MTLENLFTTVNSLSRVVVQGFEKIDHHFDRVDVRLNEHDARFDSVDRQLGDIRHELHQVGEVVLKDHERRVQALEARK